MKQNQKPTPTETAAASAAQSPESPKGSVPELIIPQEISGTSEAAEALFADLQSNLDARHKEEARAARKDQDFDTWPLGKFVGEVEEVPEERIGTYGTFQMLSFRLIWLEGDVIDDAPTLVCVIPRGNRGDFTGMRSGEKFAGIYAGKYTPSGKSITSHALTIRRI